MADFASEIQFGGDVYSPISEPAPPMGSGDFNDNFKRTCYISRIRLVDSSNALFEPENISIQAFTDKPSCYQVSLKDMLCRLGDLEAQLVMLNEVKVLLGHE